MTEQVSKLRNIESGSLVLFLYFLEKGCPHPTPPTTRETLLKANQQKRHPELEDPQSQTIMC